MSDRVLEIQSEARLMLNYIPSGRQLPRTPPLMSVKKQLDFCSEDSSEELEERAEQADGGDQDDDNQNATFDFNTLTIKSEPDDPSAMLRGMTGYQLTQTDSEFMEKMRVEKLVNKLQGELEALQRLFVTERTSLEQALVSRKKAQDGLRKLPSCEDLADWVKVVLETTSPSTDVTGLDAKALLAVVARKDVERVTDEKRVELSRLKKRAANKRKKEAHAKGRLEKQVALEQLEIQGLMSQLSDLTSELAQQEEVYKALKLQLSAPEIPADDVDSSEDLRAAKRRATRGADALGATETSQDTTNQRKSARSNLGDGRSGVKDEQAGAPKTKPRSGAADQKKRAGGPRQKAGAQESRESVGGRRKPPGSTAPEGKLQKPPGPASPQGKPQKPPGHAAPQGKPQKPPGPASPQGKPQKPPGPAAPQGKPQKPPGPAAPQGKPQRPPGPAAPPQGKPQRPPGPAAPPQGKPQRLPGPAAPQGKPQRLPGPAAPQGRPQSPEGAGEALSSSLQGRKRTAEASGEEAQPPVLRRSKRIASRR